MLGEHRGRQGRLTALGRLSKNGKWLVSTSNNGYGPHLGSGRHDAACYAPGHGAARTRRPSARTTRCSPRRRGRDGQVTWSGHDRRTAKSTKLARSPQHRSWVSPSRPKAKWFVTGGSDPRFASGISRQAGGRNDGGQLARGRDHCAVASRRRQGQDRLRAAPTRTSASGRSWATRSPDRKIQEAEASPRCSVPGQEHPAEDKTLLSGPRRTAPSESGTKPDTGRPSALTARADTVNGFDLFPQTGNTSAAAFADGMWRRAPVAAGGLTEIGPARRAYKTATGVAYSGTRAITLVSWAAMTGRCRSGPRLSRPRPKDKSIKSGRLEATSTRGLFVPDERDSPPAAMRPHGPPLGFARSRSQGTHAVIRRSRRLTLAYAGRRARSRSVTSRCEVSHVRRGCSTRGTLLRGTPGRHQRGSSSSPTAKPRDQLHRQDGTFLGRQEAARQADSITTFETYVNASSYSRRTARYLVLQRLLPYDKKRAASWYKDGKPQLPRSTVRRYGGRRLQGTLPLESCGGCCPSWPSAPAAAVRAGSTMASSPLVAPPARPRTAVFMKGSETRASASCRRAPRTAAGSPPIAPTIASTCLTCPPARLAAFLVHRRTFGSLALAPDSRHIGIAVNTGVTLFVVRLEETKK